MAAIAAMKVSDPPEVWSGLGFRVDAGAVQVGATRFDLGADGKGLCGWTLAGVAAAGDVFEGIPTQVVDAEPAGGGEPHPNGVTTIDHVVLLTPDLDRTIASLEAAGLRLRRTREGEAYGSTMKQAFFRLGEAILEVIGAPRKSGDGPARFFGIAFTVADLDATAAFLGERLHPAKDAVQPGRRIATLDRDAGSRVAMAFMSPGDQSDQTPE